MIRRWLLRWLKAVPMNLLLAEHAEANFLRGELSRQRLELAESEGCLYELRKSSETCRKEHWRLALAAAVADVKEMEARNGTHR